VEAHLEPNSGVDKSWRRNASLAKVTVLFKEDSSFSLESSSETDRLDILQEYLIKYGSATTTYDDLRSFVERLKDQEKKSLLQRILGSEIFGNPFSESDNVSVISPCFPSSYHTPIPHALDVKVTLVPKRVAI
jgi:hypothetical protein